MGTCSASLTIAMPCALHAFRLLHWCPAQSLGQAEMLCCESLLLASLVWAAVAPVVWHGMAVVPPSPPISLSLCALRDRAIRVGPHPAAHASLLVPIPALAILASLQGRGEGTQERGADSNNDAERNGGKSVKRQEAAISQCQSSPPPPLPLSHDRSSWQAACP